MCVCVCVCVCARASCTQVQPLAVGGCKTVTQSLHRIVLDWWFRIVGVVMRPGGRGHACLFVCPEPPVKNYDVYICTYICIHMKYSHIIYKHVHQKLRPCGHGHACLYFDPEPRVKNYIVCICTHIHIHIKHVPMIYTQYYQK